MNHKNLSLMIVLLSLISLVTSTPLIHNPSLPLVSRQEEATSSGNGSNDWNDLINVPAGFADNIDNTTLGGTDGNNYTYGGNVTGSSTKTINLFVSGGPNVSFTFNDNDADTDTWSTNTSAYLNRTQILGLNYWNDTYATFNKSYADTLYYSISNPSNYITDGNTNWDNSYNFTTNESCTAFINSTGLVRNWSSSSYVETDPLAYNGTLMYASNWNATNTSYYLTSNPSLYITNSTMNKTVSCSHLIGADLDFCNDADTDTDTWNTTEQMQDAVGGGINSSLRYDDAGNQIGVNETWVGDKITSYNYITDGNTNWDNSYNFTTNESALQYVNSSGLIKNWNDTGLIKNWSSAPIVDTDTWNTTEEMQDAVLGGANTTIFYNDTANSWGVNQTWLNNLITAYGYITGYTETDPKAYNGTLAYASSLNSYVLIANLVSLVGNWTLDKPNYANWSNSTSTFLLKSEWNATNTSYYLASNPSSYITNATMNKTVSCSNIIGADADFCNDATGAGEIGNPFNQVLNVTSNVTFNEVYINTTTELSNNHSLFSIDTSLIYETQRGYLFVIDDDPNTGGTGEGYFAIYNNPTGNTVVYGANNGGGADNPLDPSTDSIAVAHMFTDDWLVSKTTPTYLYRSQAPSGQSSNVFRILTKTDWMYFGDTDNSSVKNIYFNSTNATFSGDLNISKSVTSPTLAVSSCDVKAHSGNGTIYCGTDATGSGTDTNETSRFENLTNTDCSAGNLVIGVQSNGTVLCAADATGGGLTEWVNWTKSPTNVTSSTAATNLSDLFVTLSANSNYSIECNFIDMTGVLTTGTVLVMNTSGSPTAVTWTFLSTTSASAILSTQGTSTTSNTLTDTGSSGTARRSVSTLMGWIQTAGSAVSLTYGMRAEVSSSYSLIDKGSICKYTKVG